MLLHQEENLRFINLENAEEFSERKSVIILGDGGGGFVKRARLLTIIKLFQ